ncbi:aprataxin and PNK-like factor isoform X2 [Heterodontus francisci]|uniref:aprataxin and PNK-like factor isoform X2 n=1 Tax=Heterodontus francisci TaxID=7792 RepID=UPI00355C0BA0
MELEPQDGSGTIALVSGLSAIGRGPLFRLHTNPCFYRSSSGDQFLPLEKDKWHWLNPGDSFSLLPDKYIYKVISSSLDQTLRNSDQSSFEDITDEHTNSPGNLHMGKGDANEGPDISQGHTVKPTTSSGAVTTDDHSREQSSAFEPNSILQNPSKSEQLKNGHAPQNPVQRKRILPAWMLQVTAEILSTSSTVSKKGNVRGRGRGKSDVDQTQTQVTQPGRKRHESFENVKENEATDQPQEKKSRRKKTEPNEDEEQSKNNTKENTLGANSTNVKGKEEMKNKLIAPSKANDDWRLDDTDEDKSQHNHGSHQSHEVSDWVVSRKEEEEEVQRVSRGGEQESETTHTHSPKPDEPEPAEGASAFQSIEQKKPRRAPCMYGSNCYRKNPVHFQELSHPGDADYEDSTDGEEDDDRPECPFGTACYRKNLQHKKEYKHTQPPESELRRPKGKVVQKGKSGLDDESDDGEYDLNDSFIDDEEEDLDPTDEDSEWEPSSDSNEDIDTLTKEANRFVKNKK